ncbi:SMC-Scp complex subunit ScpB [Limosilactobacillus antri]|uniref:Segregation and condensation protein B n=1 Tax=Limosilactobacillus antri DSM 16041 TaxID=525309 RepID=C8P851_9LACO|nr:SMC-Scp complex subunit ScpB [Limosilactobacillus antri]EEW53351.1 segregation and condensation protein B [Limosilactobacillus antri DSM 16041]KRK59621.1 segregation and condensation protein B [Limosilactobacillus antri DSM 16041]
MTKTQASNLAQVEGLLFISGDEGITLGDLAKITGFMKPALRRMLADLQTKYAQDQDSALILLQSADTYRLATKQELAPVIKHFFEVPLTVPLTTALLETLAIIAYRQPITRLEIDSIRGVQSSGGIQKLMVRGLIDTKGRLDAPGRPFLYVTTDNFLDYFGLGSLDELPALPEQVDADDPGLSGDLFLAALQSRERHEEEK